MTRPEPRLVKGFRDVFSADVALKRRMVEAVRGVYERYGYVPLETPAVEFVDVLGKHLPESSTPSAGIFAFRNPDLEPGEAGGADEWMSLRYDLTAPLARVAAQYAELPRPFRRYQIGPVWRHEKPGPGRFREFTQFDFDAVGAVSVAADAEVCCVMCDALEALGFARGEYAVRVNNRKVMQGVLEACGMPPGASLDEDARALDVLRAVDKLDRLGEKGVEELLGKGRKDESGAFTPGVGLDAAQIGVVMGFLRSGVGAKRGAVVESIARLMGDSAVGRAGAAELATIHGLLETLGYGDDRVVMDPTIIRGLAYYTGPVFEGVITKRIVDETGQARQFGSVYGGGRYDGLVERFTGTKVPATGASVGVDRMLEAMKLLRPAERPATADVLVLVIEADRLAWYMAMAQKLRAAGLNAEVYFGEGGMRKQVKYADKLGIPFAVVAGGDEMARGVVQIKDMAAGAAAAASGAVQSNEAWRSGQASQREVAEAAVVEELVRLVKR